MAKTVVTGSSDNAPRVGTLFEGLKFFVQRNVPTWKQLVNDIKANGGHVLLVERGADFLIADHLKTNALGGSYSYTLIEAALKNGTMPVGEGMAAHAINALPAAQRPVGSSLPAKSTRNAFTPEDDRILWEWVKMAEARGESLKGNTIYRPLADAHPQHTVQSWRDRYVKRLEGRPPPLGPGLMVAVNPPPSPPVTAAEDEPAVPAVPTGPARKRRKVDRRGKGLAVEQGTSDFDEFDHSDFDILLKEADDIEAIEEHRQDEAWQVWHEAHPNHTAGEWRRFYEAEVRPARSRGEGAAAKVQDPAMQDRQDKRNSDVPTPASGIHHWSQEEDGMIIQGLTRGQSARQIMQQLPPGRIPDAVRIHQTYLQKGLRSEVPDDTNNAGPSNLAPISDIAHFTSEMNVAVEDQINRESQASGHLTTLLNAPEEGICAADANQAAKERLQWEESVHLGRSNEIEHTSFAPSKSQPQAEIEVEDESDGITSSLGLALTAANLTNQQRQHKAYNARGNDIEEDDPAKDQSAYLQYLQKLVPEQVNQTAHSHSYTDNGITEFAVLDERSRKPLPSPSDEEVEDALEDNLNWPKNESDDTLQERNGGGGAAFQAIDNIDNHKGQKGASYLVDEEEYEFDDLDLTVPEPEGGHAIAVESPRTTVTLAEDERASGHTARTNQQRTRDPSPAINLLEYVRSQRLAKAEKAGTVETVELSSANPSNSQYQSSLHSQPLSQGPDEDEMVGAHTVDTQDILNAQTQHPDLHMPLPPWSDGDFDDETHVEQQRPASKGNEPVHQVRAREEVEPNVDTWCDDMIARGFEECSVTEALARTTLRPELAYVVLLEEKAGMGLPNDLPGVWSEREDRWLEGSDATKIRRLEEKHGAERLSERMKFLQECREGE